MVRIRNLLNIIILSIFILLAVSRLTYAEGFLRMGCRGKAVTEIQSYLQQLNYLRQKPSGYYSLVTVEAVKAFQLEHALIVDGIVGPKTMAAFQEAISEETRVAEHTVSPGETLLDIAERYGSSITAIMIKNGLSGNMVIVGQKLIIPYGIRNSTSLASRGHIGGIKALPWSIVNHLWDGGETATIIDIETGKSFRVGRLYGYYHADVEPLSQTDTDVMLEIYGGKWSWERRAIVVCLRNMFIAASMNGMPHGRKSIAGNGFSGQFCIHFLGSRIHQSGAVDRDHLAMIEQAATYDLNLTKFPNRQQQVLTSLPIGFSSGRQSGEL
jgi:hypothetical protein